MLYFWRCDMAFTGEEQAFCTLQFEASRSIKMKMKKFSSKFKKRSPSNKSIKKSIILVSQFGIGWMKTCQTAGWVEALPTCPGLHAPRTWPPATSCFIKSKVYSERSATIEEVRERIKKVFQEHITVQICRQFMTGYQRRLQRCLENQGDQIETGA